MSRTTAVRAGELVPIAERLRYMQAFRAGAVLVTAVIAALAPHALLVDRPTLAAGTGGYVLLMAGAHAAARLLRRRGTAIFGLTLIADGLYLAWAAYATGGPASPLRYAIVLHLTAVALLASYRTGLKLAMWHSMLLVVVYNAQKSGILHSAHEAGIGIGTPFQRLIEFSVVFWIVAIATATLTAINERELRRRRYDLEALAAMAARLEAVSEPAEVADTLIDAVGETFDFNRAVLVGSLDGAQPQLLAGHGVEAAPAATGGLHARSVLAVVGDERRSRLVSELDPSADPWLASLLPGARNLVIVPLSAESQTFGAWVGERPQRVGPRIERRVVGMVERFVSYGALALRNAWLLEHVRRAAATDGLTGVANRASFDETLGKEVSRAARRHDDVSLLLLDIDHFKRFNDSYGHQTGDEVLRRVAAQLASGCRDFDTPARYGGEEFTLILPGASGGQAAEVAERLRSAIAVASEDGRAVTVSIGVATFPLDATTPDALVAAADRALYESKRAGRDRVTVARPDAAAPDAHGISLP